MQIRDKSGLVMRYALYSVVFVIAAHVSLSAQESVPFPDSKCPSITMECPTDLLSADPNQSISLSASVLGEGMYGKLVFNWTISSGTIFRGQGTPTITVNGPGNSFTAKVEIQGLPTVCERIASCSMIWCPFVSRRFDVYGDIEEEDEKARLDSFAIELRDNPSAIGYLIAYAGRRAHVNEALSRSKRAKDYLVSSRAIVRDRIVTIDGGYREKFAVELFIAPAGANPPVASPTVERDDVQIIQKAPRRARRPQR
jgi:hypothetical protein